MNDPTPSSPPTALRMLGGLLLWLAVPLAAGIWLAARFLPQPAVGLVYLETDIWYGSAEFFKLQLAEIALDDSIKAVVVVIDSPGGEVAPTQDMYYELLSLRQQMPVVGSINGVAASGGYYLALATDPIFAKPNSTIGNVGVWGFAPPELTITEVILASGPFKLTATNTEEFTREIEGMKQEFLNTVLAARGEDRLTISLADLSQGLAYPGRTALEYGLIDNIGSRADAIARAAELAGIANYRTIDLQDIVIDKLLEEYGESIRPGYDPGPLLAADPGETAGVHAGPVPIPWYLLPWSAAPDPLTGQRQLPPGIYLLYDMRLGGLR